MKVGMQNRLTCILATIRDDIEAFGPTSLREDISYFPGQLKTAQVVGHR